MKPSFGFLLNDNILPAMLPENSMISPLLPGPRKVPRTLPSWNLDKPLRGSWFDTRTSTSLSLAALAVEAILLMRTTLTTVTLALLLESFKAIKGKGSLAWAVWQKLVTSPSTHLAGVWT